MVEATKDAGSAVLRPRARLISLIGEELISDEPVAVVELVKNAFDADASTISVSFKGETVDQPDRLIVSDDGIGMSLATVLTSWFEPGTIAKRDQLTSPGGRPYQGAKGIGRFASARLARNLILESSTGDGASVYVLIDWGKFQDDGYLDEVTLDYESRSTPGASRGTRLTMEGLRKNWTHEDFERLQSRLSRLISPFDEVHDFRITLEAPGVADVPTDVRPPELVLNPKYQLSGHIDADGIFDGRIEVDGLLQRTIPDLRLGGRDDKVACGPFSVEIRAWDRDRQGLEPLVESLSTTLLEIRRTLDDYCGVSIYRNGFRVHPYGERGDDWLGLDSRTRQNPVTRLANNQVVAAIRVSREENPDLRDRSTREGLIRNAATESLARWFLMILALLEEERYKMRPRETPEARAEPIFESFDIRPVVRLARNELGAKHPVTVMITDNDRQLRAGVERVQATFSRLLFTAGLGQMIDVVLHEIGAPLGKIVRQLTVLENELRPRLDEQELATFDAQVLSIRGWLEQVQGLRQRLEPQTAGRRGRASSFDVADELHDDFELYRALLDKQGITYAIRVVGEPIVVTMSRAALSQIIVNLLDNSIYWVTQYHGAGKGGRIDVEVTEVAGGFRILFSDDGGGVSRTDRSSIFEPYFTKKSSGIGLGLYIARFLVEPYGRLILGEDCRLGGACFDLTLDRGVGR